MRVLDLFSGIGGFSLGLERAGMRTVAFCERDEYCRAVLRKHWPAVPCFDDIHGIDADRLGGLGAIDVVCGGFPCQPFSVAGKQRAQADDRHLWPQMLRVIALARPTWVVGENVTGLIPLALDDVLFDLEALGYATRTFVIPAVAVDAPHRRDRLWIVATNTNGQQHKGGPSTNERPASTEFSSYSNSDGQSTGAVNAETPRMCDVADTEHSGFGGRNAERRGPGTALPSGWWQFEPDVGRVAHGVPRRVDRLRCLGNAVVPQVVEEIGRAIMRCARA